MQVEHRVCTGLGAVNACGLGGQKVNRRQLVLASAVRGI